jgi:hypothetical protein
MRLQMDPKQFRARRIRSVRANLPRPLSGHDDERLRGQAEIEALGNVTDTQLTRVFELRDAAIETAAETESTLRTMILNA